MEIEMTSIPRPEHPRPDLYRENWLNLNGEWEFELDNDRLGLSAGYPSAKSLRDSIILPFCPESTLSGVGNTDFMAAVWYRRAVTIPSDWVGMRVLLHIGAADFLTRVYLNGTQVSSHRGGYTPICCDITDALVGGEENLVIYCEDDTASGEQPSGKQSSKRESYGCFYTRTTGIWQTVWLEAVPKAHIVRYNATSNITDGIVTLDVYTRDAVGCRLTATASFCGEEMGSATLIVCSNTARLSIPLREKHLWEVGRGKLYDLELTLDGEKVDTLRGYFGLREIALMKDGFYLNGKRVYGRFVLDQGFYPDGIYTAPTDEALVFDIEASMRLGFNGARLHQKIFEPRFLYHADRRGYLVFGESGNWGLDHTDPMGIYSFLPEWREALERDMSHPSIIGRCPFNETWDIDGREQSNEHIELVYDLTHTIDPTRPVIANSGSLQTRNDLYDVHDYTQLTDVEQEQNGLLTYDRRFKYPPERLALIFGEPSHMGDQMF